ncbi:hypothetical protein MGG_16000 [Pyricularia oryzae 70-15]|uniref:Uncharacterized protein n=1 Tax=Pyricularia oryzae (strain 70-15 / ATCC MYA-4617 / FGSC 8958) TaxID=242507 RepID=G4MMS5_PYRO7|nr:uncharacterized protein MGG_16000 [Pyricularia oryzae 70-15]EHA56155.1 hypothetical protein MGG_16000 [Pyricularia oryzae 70-15]
MVSLGSQCSQREKSKLFSAYTRLCSQNHTHQCLPDEQGSRKNMAARAICPFQPIIIAKILTVIGILLALSKILIRLNLVVIIKNNRGNLLEVSNISVGSLQSFSCSGSDRIVFGKGTCSGPQTTVLAVAW